MASFVEDPERLGRSVDRQNLEGSPSGRRRQGRGQIKRVGSRTDGGICKVVLAIGLDALKSEGGPWLLGEPQLCLHMQYATGVRDLKPV